MSLLALAGMAGMSLGGGRLASIAALACGLAAAWCVFRGVRAARRQRYDLRLLTLGEETDASAPDEPVVDYIPPEEQDSVYCAWCDEAFDAVEPRCLRCGRSFR